MGWFLECAGRLPRVLNLLLSERIPKVPGLASREVAVSSRCIERELIFDVAFWPMGVDIYTDGDCMHLYESW